MNYVQWMPLRDPTSGLWPPMSALIPPNGPPPATPEFIYKGNDPDELRTALLNYGIVWDGVNGEGKMFRESGPGIDVIIFSNIQDGEGKYIEFTEDGITLNPQALDNVKNILKYTNNSGEDAVEVTVMTPSQFDQNMHKAGGFHAKLPGGGLPPPELVNPIIVLTNPGETHLGAQVKGGLINHGSIAGITSTAEGSIICLKPKAGDLSEHPAHQTRPFELTGYFAVEIAGVMVPHYFKAEDLGHYFNSENPHGVMFEPVLPIKCTPTVVSATLGPAHSPILEELDYRIKWSVNDGPIQEYEVGLFGASESAREYRNVFKNMMDEILDIAGATLVRGSGGLAHYQLITGTAQLVGGDPDSGIIDLGNTYKITFYQPDYAHDDYNDLFLYFFGPEDLTIDAISCGLQDFIGY